MRNRRVLSAVLAATWAVVACSAPFAGTAGAAAGLQLTTPYPNIVVESGKSVTLDIKVITPVARRVDLAMVEVPAGWQATLQGGGHAINGVFGDPTAPPTVQLNVKAPPGAAKGSYRVAVKGTSAGVEDILPVDFTVAEVLQGALSLSSQFPSQRGPADRTFSYKLDLVNNTPESTNFNLLGEGPPGWQITVNPSLETQATTVKVDAGATQEITASVDPPDEVTAGRYTTKIRAESGDKKAEVTLETEITGSAKLALTTASGRLNTQAVAGKPAKVDLSVKNDGSTAVTGVKLTSTPPTGWKVTFKPETVRSIAAKGESKAVALITPSGDAVSGDYNIDITATGAGSTAKAAIRVTVKTSNLFGLLGLAVIAAAVYVLVRIFNQYGRR